MESSDIFLKWDIWWSLHWQGWKSSFENHERLLNINATVTVQVNCWSGGNNIAVPRSRVLEAFLEIHPRPFDVTASFGLCSTHATPKIEIW